MSSLISQTRKEVPADVKIRSHELLIRAGYIHQLGAGIFSSLPLLLRVQQKIEKILREELAKISGQELSMPIVQPDSIWKETGRWDKIGPEMTRFSDRKQHEMTLAMTHEEAATDLARQFIKSYKQLPLLVYQIQTKWRDDARPRAGLIRVREFTMKDSYSFDLDLAGLEEQYKRHYEMYFEIFNRCALPVHAVAADTGMMGGQVSHEFMYYNEIGEDSVLYCESCDYKANRQVAKIYRPPLREAEEQLELEDLATAETRSIDELAAKYRLEKSRLAKMVFLVARIAKEAAQGLSIGNKDNSDFQDYLIAAMLPGNYTLNESKLANLLKAQNLRPALAEEIARSGAVAGYASPINLNDTVVVIDEDIAAYKNWISGANRLDTHQKNLNHIRDFKADFVADIIAAEQGHRCINCRGELKMTKAVEVANIFQLAQFYSSAMQASFLDKDGKSRDLFMGSYGIGIGRLIACIAEHYADDRGLAWPINVAPYQVHLLLLAAKKSNEPSETAEELYTELLNADIEVLFDDRRAQPGFKFNDADLIGIPIRLTVSEKSLGAGGLELKLRNSTAAKIIENKAVSRVIIENIKKLEEESNFEKNNK